MGAILAVKTKNAIKRSAEAAGVEVDFSIKNIVVNGYKRGCSGFVVNPENNSIVYLNTEESCASFLPPFLYRYADHLKDYTGYHNRYAKSLDEYADAIVKLLKTTPQEAKDFRV